jgi:mRNA interferase MazF
MAMVCPITTQNKGFAMNVALDGKTQTQGVVLTADAKVLDLQARNYEYIEDVPEDILLTVLEMVGGISKYQNV